MSKPELTTITLTVLERVLLRMMLTAERGNLMTAEAIEKFAKSFGFSEDEIVALSVVETTDGSVTWQPGGADRAYKLTPWRLHRVQAMLQALDKADGVEQRHLPLFRKFGVTPPEIVDPELLAEFAEDADDEGVQEAIEEAEAALVRGQ